MAAMQPESVRNIAQKFGSVSPKTARKPIASPRTAAAPIAEMKQTLEEIENAVNNSYSQVNRPENISETTTYSSYRRSQDATTNPVTFTAISPPITKQARSSGESGAYSESYQFRSSSSSGQHGSRIQEVRYHVESSGKTYQNDEEATYEMIRLNNILASYTKEISALEARNQSLVEELKRLRLPIDALERFEERMKSMMKPERIEWTADELRVRTDLANATAEAADLRARYDAIERMRQAQASKIVGLQQRVAQLEAQIGQMQAQSSDANGRWQLKMKDNEALIDQLRQINIELEMERGQRASFEQQMKRLQQQTLEYEKIVTMVKKELENFTVASHSEVIKADLREEIERIRLDYANSRDVLKAEFDKKVEKFYALWLRENKLTEEYRVKLGEHRAQHDRYKMVTAENEKHRLRVEALQRELSIAQSQYALLQQQYEMENQRWQQLHHLFEKEFAIGNKSRLYGEVVLYREILEGGGSHSSHIETKVAETVEDKSTHHHDYHSAETVTEYRPYDTSAVVSQATKEALDAHYVGYERGSVLFHEMDEKGRFVVIKNVGSIPVNFNGWVLKQITNNKYTIEYPMPTGVNLRPGKMLKIWATGHGGLNAPPEQLVNENEHSWGIGANVKTFLFDDHGKEQARYVDTLTSEYTSHSEQIEIDSM